MGLSFVGSVAAVLLAYATVESGYARSLSERALKSSSMSLADAAIQRRSADPDAYRIKSAIQLHRSEPGEALKTLRQAISLRPADYSLWMEFARALDTAGETAAALDAFREARRLAPAYATTNYDLGLQLVKLGRFEEGLSYLRVATTLKPALRNEVIGLVEKQFPDDAVTVFRVMEPRTRDEQLELIDFIIRNAKKDEPLPIEPLTERLTTEDRRRLIFRLIEVKRFEEASLLSQHVLEGYTPGVIQNGSFEDRQLADTPFAWNINRAAAKTSILIEENDNARHCLRIDWNGNAQPEAEILSQLVLVEPETQYELRFTARAQNLITGDGPFVQVTDVSDTDRSIAKSQPLPLGNSDWQGVTVNIITGRSTRAIRIGLRRDSCDPQPCPIFGTLWLDDFSLNVKERPNVARASSPVMSARDNR